MKKIIHLLFCFLPAAVVNAQSIGINSSGSIPDISAMLDVVSTSKGLLIPRVALVSSTDAVTISTPAASLLVYNTGTGGLSPAGYYYNSGTTGSPVWVQLLNGGAPGTAWLLAGNGGTNSANQYVGTSDATDLVLRTAGTQRIYVRAGGVVNIVGDAAVGSTLAPTERFYVVDGSNRNTVAFATTGNSFTSSSVLNVSSTTTGGVGAGSTKMINIARSGANTNASHTAYGMYSAVTNTGATSTNVSGYFSASGATNNYGLIIPSGGGNAGIGTSVPAYQLTLGGTGSVFGVENTAVFTAKNSAATYEQYFWPRWSDNIMYMNYGSGGFNIRNNSSALTMFMSNAGDVGIGMVPTGSYKVEVSGRLKTTGINETSDIRLKKNVLAIDNALAKVQQLRGVSYEWRVDEFKDKGLDTRPQIGLIAQEVEKIFPQLVGTDNAGFKSVEYSKVVAVLIEAIKEQQKLIEAQQREIVSQQAEIADIKKTLGLTINKNSSVAGK